MEMKIALLNDIFVSHGAHPPRSGIEYVRLPVVEPTESPHKKNNQSVKLWLSFYYAEGGT